LILLFCVWAIVGLALSRMSHDEHGHVSQRILVAGALISLSRFLPIIVGLLDRLDGVSMVRLGPPLERFVDTVTAILICSAFVLPRQKKTLNRILVASFVFLTLGLYVIAAFQWASILTRVPAALYNRATQRWIWELVQLILLIPAFFYVLLGPVEERDALGASLGVLAVAHIAQIFYPLASQIPHAAGWVRLGNLIAFPLLGVSTYLLIFQRFEAEATELRNINKQSLAQITNLMSLLEANTTLSRSLDQSHVLRSAAQLIAQELQSDLCAIALDPSHQGASEATESKELELAVVFDTPDVFFEGTRFALRDYPVIEHAVTLNRPAILGSQGPEGYDVSASPDATAAILRLLSSDQQGSLIVQPIEKSTAGPGSQGAPAQALGAMLICRTDRDRIFTADDVHKSESLATYLGAAIENAHQHSHTEARIEQLVASQHALETEHVRTKTDLENRLQESKEQAAAFMQRMYEAERGEQQAQKDAHQVHREMARLQQESQQELIQARTEIRRGIQHATRLTQRIAELDSERIRLTNLVKALQMEQETEPSRHAVTADKGSDVSTRPSSTERVDAEPPIHAKGEHWAQIEILLDDLSKPTSELFHDTERLANGSFALGGPQRSLLNRIRVNAERTSLLLGNLATLREVGAGTLASKPVPTHVANLMQHAVESVRFQLGARQLRTRLSVGAVPMVRVDPAIVQRILSNLLDTLCGLAQEGTTIGIQAFIEQNEDQFAAEPPDLHIALSGTTALDSNRAMDAPSAVDGEIVQALARTHNGRVWRTSHPDRKVVYHLTTPFHGAGAGSDSTLGAGDRRG
jgi:signal transduction histidine kinase